MSEAVPHVPLSSADAITAVASLQWAAEHTSHNSAPVRMPAESLMSGRRAETASAAAAAKGDFDVAFIVRRAQHFCLLSIGELRHLTRHALRREFSSGDWILPRGAPLQHAYVVLGGVVDVITLDEVYATEDRVGSVEMLGVFGFDSLVLQERSPFLFRCGSPQCTVLMIPAADIMDMLRAHVPLRQSIAAKMSEQTTDFRRIKDFCRLIFSHETVKYENVPLHLILEMYGTLNSGLHRLKHSKEIDTMAWLYAVRRLPENITRAFSLDLVRSLPPFLANRMRRLTGQTATRGNVTSPATDEPSGDAGFGGSSRDLRFVPTASRRRCTWQLGAEGKTLVLLRDGFSDMLDFILCLCIHITESSKLRARLQGMVHPPAVDLLDEYLHERDRKNTSRSSVVDPTAITKERLELTSPLAVEEMAEWSVLSKMPLSHREREDLVEIWKSNVLEKLYEIIMHREEFLLRADSSVARRFQSDPFHDWALGIRGAILRKLNLSAQSPLPDALIIDVIVSNTHSVKNCVSSFGRIYREEILDFGRTKHPDVMRHPWHNMDDCVYRLIPAYLAANPGLRAEFTQCLGDCGVEVLEDTSMTGLQVDIIPVDSLRLDLIDPSILRPITSPTRTATPSSTTDLPSPCATPKMEGVHTDDASTADLLADALHLPSHAPAGQPRHFLVNMDYTFGANAEGMTKALVLVFGHRIRSFNVMNKAASLVGKRGDVIIADRVLLSKMTLTTEDCVDELRTCDNAGLSAERLQTLLGPGRSVHVGTMLTVASSMLNNDRMLNFYRNVWNCVGFELEGSYFNRMITECIKNGLVRPDIITRYCYFTREMPLEENGPETYAREIAPHDGIPSLYAIARAILELVLFTE